MASRRPRMPPALAEAVGGAIGALWTTFLFFPIDVAKVRLQAATRQAEESMMHKESQRLDEEEQSSSRPQEKSECKQCLAQRQIQNSYLRELLRLLREPGLWYRGLASKMQLAVFSSFVYFYVYSMLKRAYSRLLNRQVSFIPNLILASLAGVVNVLTTLPLDVIATRLQVSSHRQTFMQSVQAISANHPRRLWQGLTPAVILTVNPSITYAAYDLLNALLPLSRQAHRSSARQTFVIGMLSKLIATLITYPLIRAKVIMMAGVHSPRRQEGRSSQDLRGDKYMGGQHAVVERRVRGDCVLSPALQDNCTLIPVLRGLIEEGGVSNLYVGLDAQVFNTALKSGVMLQMKEQISRITTYLLRQMYLS